MLLVRSARLIVLLAPLFVARQTLAAPPPGTDLNSPIHTWFEHQHSIIGNWCCKVADGHILSASEWRRSAAHYEVRIDGVWYPVPPTSLRDPAGDPNPTGQAVVWWSRFEAEITIHCFAPGSEM
jgi:hypothetical protein